MAAGATFVFRYLAQTGLPNDSFEHLAGAQQMLAGEWPTRDFVDPGMPLTYAASALSRLIFGPTLLAEALLNAGAFAIAAAATLFAARALAASWTIAWIATLISVAAFPRPYAYPKVLMTALMAAAICSFQQAPAMRRLVVLSLLPVIGFLFRHDYGAYLGTAAILAAALAPADAWRVRVQRVALAAGLMAMALLPYAIYLEVSGGFAPAVASVLDYGRNHAARTRLHFDTLWASDAGRLFYLFHAMTVVAGVMAVFDVVRRKWSEVGVVLPLVCLAVLTNVGLLRDPLEARLPDAIVPVVLLGAWLAGRARQVHGRLRLVTLAGAPAATVVAVSLLLGVVQFAEQWDRTGVRTRGMLGIPRLMWEQTQQLHARFTPRQLPNGRTQALVPFFEYLDRCTHASDRLLVTGYAPEIYFYARRPFAGGQKVYIEGYYRTAADEALVRERLRDRPARFIAFLTDEAPQWRASYPNVNADVDSAYGRFAEIPIDDERTLDLRVNRASAPTGTDAATGWPCYK